MSDSDEESDGSLFDDSEESDDGIEALRAERQSYRKGVYKSRGVLSKEWIAVRDALRKSDDSAFAKIHMMLKRGQKEEVQHGTWGGSNLLHHAARYGRKNCVKLLLSLGVKASKVDGKRRTPLKLARDHGHSSVALIIEFWDSPTVNRKWNLPPPFSS